MHATIHCLIDKNIVKSKTDDSTAFAAVGNLLNGWLPGIVAGLLYIVILPFLGQPDYGLNGCG